MIDLLLTMLEGVCGEDEGILDFSAYADVLLVLVKGQPGKSLEVDNERVMTSVSQCMIGENCNDTT